MTWSNGAQDIRRNIHINSPFFSACFFVFLSLPSCLELPPACGGSFLAVAGAAAEGVVDAPLALDHDVPLLAVGDLDGGAIDPAAAGGLPAVAGEEEVHPMVCLMS